MNTAVLATHVQLEEKGLRQKDVRFMLELLASWRWAADERGQKPPLHNTQILRRLRELAGLGWLKPLSRKGAPRYRLTRAGLVGILESLRQTALHSEFSTYWFLSFILQAYRERLLQLIEKEGSSLPLPQRIEVEKILDGKAMVKERRQLIKDRLHYWQRRIQENQAVVDLVQTRVREKVALEDIVAEIERRYPYELNLTKPISTFIAEIPHDLKVWELTEGQSRRAKMVWQAFAKSLELELGVLDQSPLVR
ncbi:MAG: hypothetical protein AB7K41_11565 [Bdellovibrionales bacterium]